MKWHRERFTREALLFFLFWALYILLGQWALSVIAQSDNTSSAIDSNKVYVANHQLGGQAGKNKKTTIPARYYLSLTNDEYEEILSSVGNYLK